jgi:hypothetical protein
MENNTLPADINFWFEEDWKKFVNHIREENRRSNYRLMKVVAKMKGKEYVNSLKLILKTVGTGSLIKFSKEAKGFAFNKPEWAGIGEVYINQRSTSLYEGMMTCDIYMPVKEGKFLHITTYQ